jgi:hypothetical protein
MLVATSRVAAQELNLPRRAPDAIGGTAFASEIATLELRLREERIYTEVVRGNVPTWLRTLVPVRMSRRGGEHEASVTFWVTPDYLAVGSDSDYFLMPMSPHLAQRLADLTDTSLPTVAMVDAVWAAAPVRLGPDSIAPTAAMITVPVFADHNRMVRERRDRIPLPQGTLVAGHKKDVVLSVRLDSLPRRVAIYGWHKPDGRPIQPLNTWHTTEHVDYSHGIRLVHHTVQIDGRPYVLSDALRDTTLAALLNHDGALRKARYETTWP